MQTRFLAAALVGAFLIPATAQAQSRVKIPDVELFATVTGKWVLDPRRCNDIREDIRDARRTTSRRDRREDRRDQRVAACPASAYDFIPDAGQGPKYPVRVGRGRVPRKFRGRPMFINGDTIGSDGLPLEASSQTYAPEVQQYVNPQFGQQQPAYQQPAIQQPTYRPAPAPQPTFQPQQVPQPTYQPVQPTTTYQAPAQPTYQQPTYQQPTQPVFQQPTYQQPTYQQPTFQQPAAPAVRAPTQSSSYEIINGVIVFD